MEKSHGSAFHWGRWEQCAFVRAGQIARRLRQLQRMQPFQHHTNLKYVLLAVNASLVKNRFDRSALFLRRSLMQCINALLATIHI